MRCRYYETELGKAEVRREGSDITIVGWGGHMRSLEQACDLASAEGISCELINLRTILPWDADAIQASVEKTGRLIVSHEAPRTMGFAAEIISEIQERSFLSLESPAQRVCGYDMPFPLARAGDPERTLREVLLARRAEELRGDQKIDMRKK